MDWLRSEDLKEEKNETAPIVIIAVNALCRFEEAVGDHHVPGRVTLVNGVSIRRNSLSHRPQFFLLVPLGTSCPRILSFKSPYTDCGDPETRNNQCDPPAQRD